MSVATAETVLRALGDGTRQRLMQLLLRHELGVSELVEVLAQPQSTLSRHLKALNEAGLLVGRRVGAVALYAARPPAPLEAVGGGKDASTRSADRRRGPNGVAALQGQLLEWLGRQPLDAGLRERLERVIRCRRADKTRFFDTMGARWDQLRIEAFGDTFHFEALVSLLPRAWRVADIGTGTGYSLAVLSGHFRRVVAVDAAAGMLEVARSRPEVASAANVEFRQGSLAALPLADGEVDLAIASLVLHHVDRPARAIRELRRCLPEGGRVMIIEQQAHRNAAFHERMGDHGWGFMPATLRHWLERAGFADVETRPLTTARPTGRDKTGVPGLFVATARASGPAAHVDADEPGHLPDDVPEERETN